VARLGELLVARGACAREQVRQALENQVIFGARLGTNLLEIGSLEEEALAQALAQQTGRPALWGEIAVDAHALRLLTSERADRLEAVPLRLEGRRLAVLMADPSDLRKVDELSFATGKDVRPVVVPEARLWALLRRHYGVDRHLRGIEVEHAHPTVPPPAAGARGVTAPPDLIDEAAFQALYDPVEGRPAAPAVPVAPFAGALMTDRDVLDALQIDAVEPAPREREAIALDRGGAPEPPPLDFEEASRELDGAQGRDAIARIVLRCARSRARRALLLAVRKRHADGWEGLGEGLTAQAVARIRVPLDQAGIFQTVVASRAHFLGPMQKTPANVRFLRALGGGAPKNSFAMPVLARGRVVNVLYADNGRGELVDPGGVGELLILATRISQSYEQLLAKAP